MSAKTFKCIYCNKSTFKSIQALEQHRKSAHVLAQCQVCKRKFGDIKALNQHKSMHQQCSVKSQVKQEQPAISKAIPALEAAAQPSSSNQQLLSAIEGVIYPVDGMLSLNLILLYMNALLIQPLAFPSIPLAAPGIIYGSHTFTVLHPLEQQLMLKYLTARCHSSERLRKQGYLTATTSKATGNPYPYKSSIKRSEFCESPQNASISGKPIQTNRFAVTIDCEMVQVARGQRELAFISVVDFLTGEVLINSYVQPLQKVINWKSEISGVTASAVAAAVASGRALRGWKAARQALWEHIDSATILIGHSLQSDLSVLGVCHSRIFDSAIFTAEAVFPDLIRPTQGLKRLWGLKTLAKDLLGGLDIQNSNSGHDCLEDTMTTREIVLFCLGNPELLKLWAEGARGQYDDEQTRKKNNKGKKPNRGTRCSFSSDLMESDMDDEIEVLRWEDIAEDCGWPHPDTGYDPWSD